MASKVAQTFGDFLGYFETHHFLSKNCYGYFFNKYGFFLFEHPVTLIEREYLSVAERERERGRERESNAPSRCGYNVFVTERDNVFASHINGQSMLKSVCVCV